MRRNLKIILIIMCVILISVTTVYAASAITKNIEVTYRNIKLVVDGVQVTPKDSNGTVVEPFIYNGTTYLPVRAVGDALGKQVSWDGNTNTIYIGESPDEKLFLHEVCPPYESNNTSFSIKKAADTFIMAGKEYANGFTSKHTGRTDNLYALFNLDAKYKTLEFDVGHVDGTEMSKGALTIYLDGKVSQVIKLDPNELVKHVIVDLDYALQMKMEFSWDEYYSINTSTFGFANAELKK